MNNYREAIEQALARYIPKPDGQNDVLYEAVAYALLDGGKRIRPTLTLEFCNLCGGRAEWAMPFACAVEMIHAYSLVHDDLPCMDNDDLRRGKPSVHKKYGEATALLVGDALLNLAFETCLHPDNVNDIPAERIVRAAGTLARAAGLSGMIGGQCMDLQSEGISIPVETLETLHRKKTGALIRATAVMGVQAAGGSAEQEKSAETYADRIGLAFQIVDDILDVTGDSATIGKPAGSDEQNEKSTYVKFYGVEGATRQALALTGEAQAALAPFGARAEHLKELAAALSRRNA